MSYVRVSILGSTVGGEKWSINPVFDPTGEFPGSVNQSALNGAAAVIGGAAAPTRLMQALSTALAIVGCRIEVRDDSTDGLIALAEYQNGSPLAGSGSPIQTAQAAVVCSLRTDTAGPSGRGRAYWPAVGVAVGSTLRITTPGYGLMRDDFKTYFTTMRTALASAFPTIGFDLAVRSKQTHTTPHVTSLRVGDIIDTQRRRRDALPESYSSIAYP